MCSQSTLKSREVLLIPELASLISSFASTQDCARLLQTCKSLFAVGVPLVWQHVDNAQNILLLIRSSYKYEYRGSPSEVSLVDCFRVDNPFSIFDTYAPHVKSLDVYGRQGSMFKVKGWNILIARARQQPLLPNLHTLNIRSLCDSHGPDQPLWTSAFCSSSLVNLLIEPSRLNFTPTISFSAACVILRNITKHCPRLERLGLFPNYEDGNYGEDGESSLLALLSEGLFSDYIADATHLRHLSSTLAWFCDKSVRVLSKLPHLESISIFESGDDADYDLDLLLSDDSFPSLKRLVMCKVHPFDTTTIMDTTHLLKRLTSLDITLCFKMLDEEDYDDANWLLDNFFPLLSNVPCVSELKIVVDSSKSLNGVCKLEASDLEVFSALPLQRLYLGDVRLDDDVSQVDLGVIWPRVTSLRIPAHRVSLSSLSHFGTIPKLELLELHLDLQENSEISLNSVGSHPLGILMASAESTAPPNFEDMGMVTRAVMNMWPSLACIVWPRSITDTTFQGFGAYEYTAFKGHYAVIHGIFEDSDESRRASEEAWKEMTAELIRHPEWIV